MKENFFTEVWRRFKEPWRYLAFNLYFILFVIVISAVDVHWAFVEQQYFKGWSEPSEVAKNMAAYGLTMIMASLLEFALKPEIKNRTSSMIVSFFIAILALALFVLSYLINTSYSLLPASINVVLGLFVWIVANSDNTNYRDGDSLAESVKEETSNLQSDWK